MKLSWLLLLTLTILNFSCQKSAPAGALFSEIPRSQTNIDFRNLLIEKETFNIFKYQYFYNGGGTAVGDFNNDGLIDIVFTGLRHGEKLHEELVAEGEGDERPFHPKISHAHVDTLDPEDLDHAEWVARLDLTDEAEGRVR